MSKIIFETLQDQYYDYKEGSHLDFFMKKNAGCSCLPLNNRITLMRLFYNLTASELEGYKAGSDMEVGCFICTNMLFFSAKFGENEMYQFPLNIEASRKNDHIKNTISVLLIDKADGRVFGIRQVDFPSEYVEMIISAMKTLEKIIFRKKKLKLYAQN